MENIFDKNSTYNVIDITNALIATTDRFKDFDSARGTVNQTITKLGIQSVNGQKRNRYFTGLDAQRVFDAIPHSKTLDIYPWDFAEGKGATEGTTSEPKTKSTRALKMLTLDTFNGLVDIRPEDISMICLPPLRYYFTFRGWGSLITLRNGRQIHVKQEPYEVSKMIKDMEV